MNVQLKYSGPAAGQCRALRVYGRSELGRPCEHVVELSAGSASVSARDLLGAAVSVEIDDQAGRKRHVSGYAVRVRTVPGPDRFPRFVLDVRPGLWLLSRNADLRVFQDMTVPDIVRAVIEASGKQPLDLRLSGAYAPWRYCVQYRETDLNFINRLLEQEGIHYFFEHDAAGARMVLCDSNAAHRSMRPAKAPFRPAGVAVAQTPDYVQHWAASQDIGIERYSLNEYDYRRPGADLFATRARTGGTGSGGSAEIYDAPGEYDSAAEGERYAAARIEELAAQAERFEGAGPLFAAAPGLKFRLEEHPLGAFNAEYLLVDVGIDVSAGDATSASGGDAGGTMHYTAIRAERTFRPARVTPKPSIQGVQTATVVGPSGEEIHTDEDGLGRVKVQFHWDRYGKRDERSSCWVRVASPWANANFGVVALPRVGSEVVVAFEEGDPDRPLVTGSVYNGANKPPYALPASKTQSGIRTHSVKGGGANYNELRFDDALGSERVHLQAEKDQHVLVKNNRIVHVKLDRHDKTEADAFVTVGRQLHEKVGSDRLVEVGGSTSLKSAQDTLVKSGMRFNAESGQEIHLKAGMNVTIEAGVSLTLKVGGNFVSISPAGVAVSGTMVMINSGGAAGSGSGAPVRAPREAKETPEGAAIREQPVRWPTPSTFRPDVAQRRGAAAGGAPFV